MNAAPLWLCLWPRQLALQALADPRPQLLVYEQLQRQRWVVASSDPRATPGEPLSSAQARCAELPARRRDPAAELAALEALACRAWQLGDRVVISHDPPRCAHDLAFAAVSVDVGPSLKLFGGVSALRKRLRDEWFADDPELRFGLAPTLEGAAIAARHGLPAMTTLEALHRRLQALPLEALRWPLATLELLAGTGHQQLGALLAHPADALARRCGPALVGALARLLGTAPDPRPLFTPPERFQRVLDLGADWEDTQALLFPARRLLQELEQFLAARHARISELQLSAHRQRSLAQQLELRSSSPSRDAALWLRLLREYWTHQPPSGAVSELRLQADRLLPDAGAQTDLFGSGETDAQGWSATLDRLRARLGSTAVWQPGLVDDHRPERAWRPGGELEPTSPPWPPRPLWLLQQPLALPAGAQLRTAAERIDSGWWDDDPVRRDYHWALGANGARLWVYRQLDGDGDEQARWFVHGYGMPMELRR